MASSTAKQLAQIVQPDAARPAPLAGSDLERGIAAIWREVLQAASVELDQNFFDVGGNSGNLALVHERLQRLLERRFSITDLYAHSTIRALAAHLTKTPPNAPDHGAGAGAGAGAGINPAALRAERQRQALAAQRQVHRDRK